MEWVRQNTTLVCLTAVGGLFAIAALLPFLFSLSGDETQKGLAGWSSYGQWFGFIGAIASSLAFVVAFQTLQIQQQQIREAEKAAKDTMQQMVDQTAALKDTAEMNGLAAIIHYCERYMHIDADGESQETLKRLAADAKKRLKDKLKLS